MFQRCNIMLLEKQDSFYLGFGSRKPWWTCHKEMPLYMYCLEAEISMLVAAVFRTSLACHFWSKYELESNVTWPHATCRMILWFLVRKMRSFPRNRFMHCYMGQSVSFLDGQLCVLLFHNALVALSAFWRAGGAHEQLEDPSSLTQDKEGRSVVWRRAGCTTL